MKKVFAFFPSVVMVLTILTASIEPAYAQNVNFNQLKINLFGASGGSNIFQVLNIVLNIFLLISGIAAFFYILYGGFVYLTAGGEATKATQGRTYIVNAVIGIVLIFISFALAKFVISFTRGEQIVPF